MSRSRRYHRETVDFSAAISRWPTPSPGAPHVRAADLDEVVVPADYDYRVVVRWGDPVLRDAPRFDVRNQTAVAQSRQFGYNCDYVAVLPFPRNPDRALLVVNHEYTNEQLMFPGVTGPGDTTVEQRQVAMAAHGMSVVAIERVRETGAWRLSKRRGYNRRITASTPFIFSGPAAKSPLLRTAANPSGTRVRGTLNNCAGGTTPWGTVLSGEENFNQYFGASSPVPDSDGAYRRYGITTSGASERKWEEVDPRFDVAREPNEPNRFGWIAEVDPWNPDAKPRKRTALGRFKHEGATVTLAEDGRAVAYNMRLLDEGDRYVARFIGDTPDEIDGTGTVPSDRNFDGRGEWIPLVKDGQSIVPGRSVDWVLVYTPAWPRTRSARRTRRRRRRRWTAPRTSSATP